MKQFFKSVVQIKYTSNTDRHDYQSLKEYLIEKQMVQEDFDFESQINQFDELVQTLIQEADDEKFAEICNYHGITDERDIKDLKTVWLNDRESVYSYIIKQGTSHNKLDKVEWSINNKFYGKKVKNLKEVSCIMNLKLDDIKDQNTKYLTFEMNQEELSKLNDDLLRVEDEIRNLFEGEAEQEEEDDQ